MPFCQMFMTFGLEFACDCVGAGKNYTFEYLLKANLKESQTI